MRNIIKIKNEDKANKGITLIALVITIIVLLILAGVTIATLTGENGILGKADTAQVENRAATIEELVKLWKAEQTADKIIGENTAQTLGQLLDNLEEEKLITSEERTVIEDDGEIIIGNKMIIFEKLTATDKVGNKVSENTNDDGSINYEKLKQDLESIKNIQGVPENLGEDSFPLIVEIDGELVQINQDGTVGPATNIDVFKLASNMGGSNVTDIGLPMTFYSCDGGTSTAIGNAGGARTGFWTSSGPTWGWDMNADYEQWFTKPGSVTVTCTFYLISSYYSFEGTSGWSAGYIGVLENDAWRWSSWTLSKARFK